MTKSRTAKLAVKIISAVLGVVFIAVFAIEMQYSLASQYGRSSDRYLRLWNGQGHPPTEQQWQQALNQAQFADQHNPGNPVNLRRLGIIYEWGEKIDTLDDSTKSISTRIANMYYSRVLEHRRSWGWDWYRLFKTKIKLNEIDDQAAEALTTAMAVAPYNYDLFLYLIYYGLRSPQHSTIADHTNKATRELLQHAPSKHQALFNYYQAYQRQTQLCQMAQQLSITSPVFAECHNS